MTLTAINGEPIVVGRDVIEGTVIQPHPNGSSITLPNSNGSYVVARESTKEIRDMVIKLGFLCDIEDDDAKAG